MQTTRFSDSYDSEDSGLLALKKSIQTSIKPKFIEKLNQIQNQSFKLFQKIKKTQSTNVLTKVQENSLSSSILSELTKNELEQNENYKKVMVSLDLIKKTAVYQDKALDVFSLFQKAGKIYRINHQNKKAIKFIEICEQHSPRFYIQKTQWQYFQNFSGKGILVLPDKRKIKAKWQNALPKGKVQITYPNESIYYGEINQSFQKHGAGYLYFQNGEKLEGTFCMGKMIGSGIYYNSKGQIKQNYKFREGLVTSYRKA